MTPDVAWVQVGDVHPWREGVEREMGVNGSRTLTEVGGLKVQSVFFVLHPISNWINATIAA